MKLVGREIPPFINRLANIGNFFSCIVDPLLASMANNNQVAGNNQSSASAQNGSSDQQSLLHRSNVRNVKAQSTSAVFSTSSGRKLGSS